MNILLTSVGRRSYLVEYFKEALNGCGEIHVSNSSKETPAFKYADKSVVTPLIYNDDYIPFLLSYCKTNNIKAIISLFDIDLPILAEKKAEFSKIGTTVIVSDKTIIDTCNDKWKTVKFLSLNGFAHPKTYISLAEVKKALKDNEIFFPVIVKPRWGMASIGVYEANDFKELQILYKKSTNDIQKTYLRFESEADLDRSVIVQEKLLGEEYGLDIINDLNGKYQNTVVKKKYAMRAGETDYAETVDNHILREVGKRLSEKLRHIANLDVDIFLINDSPYILEMNARFGGGYPFSHIAGVNLPKAIVNWLNNIPFSIDSLLKEKVGIKGYKDIQVISYNN